MFTDGFSEFDHAQTVGIMGMAVVEGFAGGLLDASGSVKIGLAHFQVDHMNTLAFHFMGFFQNFHDNERGHFSGSI